MPSVPKLIATTTAAAAVSALAVALSGAAIQVAQAGAAPPTGSGSGKPPPKKIRPDLSGQCWITSRECKKFPHLNGKRIRDVYGEGMLDAANTRYGSYCHRRAEDFHHWCGNGREDGLARVAASWIKVTKFNETEIQEERARDLSTAGKAGAKDAAGSGSGSKGSASGSKKGSSSASSDKGSSKGPRGKGKGRRKLGDKDPSDSESSDGGKELAQKYFSTHEISTQVYHPSACDKGWSLYDKHCYVMVWKQKTWWEAEQWCNQFSEMEFDSPSNLCSIHGKAENEFVFTLTKGVSSWIGYHDNDQDEVKEWSDNTKTDFENMAKNCTGREETDPDCKPEETAQQWYDFQGEQKSTWVCKKPVRKDLYGKIGVAVEKAEWAEGGVVRMLDDLAGSNWELQKGAPLEIDAEEAADQKAKLPTADGEDGTGVEAELNRMGTPGASGTAGVTPNVPSQCVEGDCG